MQLPVGKGSVTETETEEEERRQYKGQFHTRQQFLEEFGEEQGAVEWDKVAPSPSTAFEDMELGDGGGGSTPPHDDQASQMDAARKKQAARHEALRKALGSDDSDDEEDEDDGPPPGVPFFDDEAEEGGRRGPCASPRDAPPLGAKVDSILQERGEREEVMHTTSLTEGRDQVWRGGLRGHALAHETARVCGAGAPAERGQAEPCRAQVCRGPPRTSARASSARLP